METANSEITTLAAAVEADAKPAEASAGESDTPVKVANASEDTSSWTEKAQKRYDELTRKAYEAQGERDRERYQREALQAELAELKAAKAKTTQVAPEDTFPTLEQYGYDEAKFVAAVAAFTKTDPAAVKTAAQEAAREELRLARQADADKASGQAWSAKEAELIKSKPDYVEKVQKAQTLPISQEVQKILFGHELGPQIALSMVENAEQSVAIMQLPLNLQLMEVGRIVAEIKAAKSAAAAPLAVSKAPPPPSKVEGAETSLAGISTTDAASDKLSDDAWVKAENARLRRKAKAG